MYVDSCILSYEKSQPLPTAPQLHLSQRVSNWLEAVHMTCFGIRRIDWSSAELHVHNRSNLTSFYLIHRWLGLGWIVCFCFTVVRNSGTEQTKSCGQECRCFDHVVYWYIPVYHVLIDADNLKYSDKQGMTIALVSALLSVQAWVQWDCLGSILMLAFESF